MRVGGRAAERPCAPLEALQTASVLHSASAELVLAPTSLTRGSGAQKVDLQLGGAVHILIRALTLDVPAAAGLHRVGTGQWGWV